MNQETNNLICRCGHNKLDHPKRYRGACWYEHESIHPCRKFKLDNLKYLEYFYDKRHDKVAK